LLARLLGAGIGPYAGMVPIAGIKPLILRGLSPKFLKKDFYTAGSNIVLGEKMSEKNEMSAGISPEAGEIFVNEPAKGMFVRAKFDEQGRLVWAIAVDEKREMRVAVRHEMGDVTIMLSWRGFELRLKKGYGYNLPGILYQSSFTKVYKYPVEYFKALLLLVAEEAEKKYESAQELFEQIISELGE